MNLIIFFVVFAVGISASRGFEDRLATALKKLLVATEAEAQLRHTITGRLLPVRVHAEEMTSSVVAAAGAIAGGLDVITKVQDILNELPMIKFLADQSAIVDQIIVDMRKEAQAMQKALGEQYIGFQNKLVIHVENTEQVGTRLLKLATTAWLRCGNNAEDILKYGYSKRAQNQFGSFLTQAIEEAGDITSKLEEIKSGVHQLKEEAISNQIIIKQYFEGEIADLEARKAKNKNLYWVCIVPIACPFVVTSIVTMKKNINSQIKYMDTVGASLLSNFEDAETKAVGVYEIVAKWIPQSAALKVALEHTANINDNLIEVLEENYINENPQEAGIRNAYLIKLFHSMQGLQIAAEGVEGFPVDQMESLGGIRVPEYPTQHDVCACFSIADIADWSQSTQCMAGAGAAMQEIDDFPWCRLVRQSCKQEIKDYLPSMCRATRA